MRPWEASENLLVKPVIFNLSLIFVPASLILVNTLSVVIWTGLGPVSEPILSLIERKDKNSHGEMEEEIGVRVRYWLIRKDIHFLWPGHGSEEVGGFQGNSWELPSSFLRPKRSSWESACFKPNVLGERTIFSLLQSILSLALCHCHT